MRAARQLGWSEIAAVWTDDDDATAKAFSLADNRTAELGGYDDAELAALIGEVQEADPALLAATGWSDSDLAGLLAQLEPEVLPPALSDPDDVPDPGPAPICAVGDLWELGPHRLAVGDSTDVTVWDRLLGGGKADMVWTDPPYGVAIVGGNHALSPEERKRRGGLTIENDELSPDQLEDFLRRALGAAFTATKPGACWYVAAPAGPLFLPFAKVLADLEVWRQTLVWAKDSFVMGRSDYHYRHEAVFYGWTPGAAHHPVPDRTQDTVHEVPRPKANKEHPTMKPVALISRHIENSTEPGQFVVDPFGGSGSTLIAAHGASRRAALIELDPKYATVICRRYQEHTGTKPTRDGVPHDFTAG